VTSAEVLARQLFEEHGAALLAYATRLSGDPAQAAEAVREALARAVREPGALNAGRGAVRAYLFSLIRDDAGMTVLTAVDALPPEQREVLHALYFQGRGLAETAASLGVPAGTVKSRSYQALHRLREAVG
jgi:RNA polymerase sigma-70 factor (ECF subfamily)